MKYIKCLKIAPETICEQLSENYQPVIISDVELNLNELAVSLIRALLERVSALEEGILTECEELCDTENVPAKPGKVIATYLISS